MLALSAAPGVYVVPLGVSLMMQPAQVPTLGSVGSAPWLVATMMRYDVAPTTVDHENAGVVVFSAKVEAEGLDEIQLGETAYDPA